MKFRHFEDNYWGLDLLLTVKVEPATTEYHALVIRERYNRESILHACLISSEEYNDLIATKGEVYD